MTVEMIKYPTDEDWLFCKQCTLNTVGLKSSKMPTEEWKHQLLKSEHSPIRTLWFGFKLEIPYWVSVHLSRHKFGCEHFVQSQRDDRQKELNISRKDKPQGEIVSHIIYVNAQELMHIARKRLCNQASKETRQVVQMMCDEVLKTNPEFEGLLVPACEYQHECNEMFPCGKANKFKELGAIYETLLRT